MTLAEVVDMRNNSRQEHEVWGSMYIELVRRMIEEAVDLHAKLSEQSVENVLDQIRIHITNTSREYRRDEPHIQYDDPLCRLGYLYMHAPVNATILEKVLIKSDDLRRIIKGRSKGILNICSMGGGPGTELLGITKFFLQHQTIVPPRKIGFTVMDNVQEWSDTWTQLAEASEEELRKSLVLDGSDLPTIADHFLSFDVLDSTSYGNFLVQFSKIDIVVFNYLFSENKTKLEEAKLALERLAYITNEDCAFVVIDRLENNPRFSTEVASLFESAFGVEVHIQTLAGTLDADEQASEMGTMLTETLQHSPRVKFFTPRRRDPTVFWFVVKRQ